MFRLPMAIPLLMCCSGCTNSTNSALQSEKEAISVLATLYDFKTYKKNDQGYVVGVSLETESADDAALAEILKFKMMRYLSLRWTRVTDNGVQKLLQLKRLEELNIASTALSDRALGHLESSSTLRDIWITRSEKLTPIGIASLKKANPELRIHDMTIAKKKAGKQGVAK